MCRSESKRPTCGGGGVESLHAALKEKNCSEETIQKLVDEKGVEALKEQDVYGRVPLFYAIRRRCSLPVVQTLFEALPESILQADFCGDLPLYMLFGGAQMNCGVLEYVLDQRPSLALFVEKRFSGSQTLLQRMCAQWMNTVRRTMKNATKTTTTTTKNRHSQSKHEHHKSVLCRRRVRSDRILSQQWSKLVLLVRAAHRMASTTTICIAKSSTKGSDKSIPELHVALQLKSSLPEAIVCQFIELYPEQASKPMTTSTTTSTTTSSTTSTTSIRKVLPLHYFLSNCCLNLGTTEEATGQKRRKVAQTASSAKPVESPLGDANLQQQQQQQQQNSNNRNRNSNKHNNLLKSLVCAFPEAASMELQTRTTVLLRPTKRTRCSFLFPLHLAIANGILWDEGLRELVYANPSALSVEDGTTTSNLVPFLQQAAVCNDGNDDDDEVCCRTSAASSTTVAAGAATTTTCTSTSTTSTTHWLNTVFCLLREDPSVLTTLVLNESESENKNEKQQQQHQQQE